VYNLLTLRDITITSVLKELPNFNNDVFFTCFEDEDLFRQSYGHHNIIQCKYILGLQMPTIEYNREFVKTISFELTPFNIEILPILFQKHIIGHASYDDLKDYIQIVDGLIANNLFENVLSSANENDFNDILALELTSSILVSLVNTQNEKLTNIIINQIELPNSLFKKLCKIYAYDLSGALCYTKDISLLSKVIEHGLFEIDNLVALLPFIAQLSCTNVFKQLLKTFNIVDLLVEEDENTIMLQDSFFLKALDIEENYSFVLNLCNATEQHDTVVKLIAYFLNQKSNFLDELVNRLTDNYIVLIMPILLTFDITRITDHMMDVMIDTNQKTIIIQCVQHKIVICEECVNKILEKYPETVLLFENTKELILKMNDSNTLALFRSPCMTPDIQDFLLEHLMSAGKTDSLVECLLNLQLQSSFLENNIELLEQLMSSNNEIYYNLMKNGICVDRYLLMCDTNGNYMLPFIPDGYIEENLVERFVNSLNISDLMKFDKFGRNIFRNLTVNPFFKYVLAKPDIGIFYDKCQHLLVAIIDDVVINQFETLQSFPTHIKYSITNSKNQNIPMILLANGNPYDAREFLNSLDDVTKKAIFSHQDNDGNDILFYSTCHSDIFSDILSTYITLFGKDIVKRYNMMYETLLMYAIKHAGHTGSVDLMLSNENLGHEQNFVYKNTGSILTYGALYLNDTTFDTLLRWKYVVGNHFDITQNFELYDWFSNMDPLTSKTKLRGSLLTIAMYKNGSIFNNLLSYFSLHTRSINTILTKEKVIIGTQSYTPVQFAYLYNPESLQHLLGLSYMSELIGDHTFFSKNYKIQPASWFHYTKSKLYVDTITNQYSISYWLRPGSHIDSIASIVQAKQECGTSMTDICSICTIGRKKILFGCQLHMTCVSCACTIEKCPECRNNEIDKKIKIFD
jgi:hypothetical protein